MNRLFWIGGQGHDLTQGISDPLFPHPVEYRMSVQQCFRSSECLGSNHKQCVFGGETLQHGFQSGTVNIRHHFQFIFLISELERPVQHLGSQRRSADAEMDDLREFAEGTGIDDFDQAFHAPVERAGILDARRVSRAAFRAMFGRPALADIYGFTGEQCAGLGGKPDVIGQRVEGLYGGLGEMGFRKIEIDTRLLQPELPRPIAIFIEHVIQRLLWKLSDRPPKV